MTKTKTKTTTKHIALALGLLAGLSGWLGAGTATGQAQADAQTLAKAPADDHAYAIVVGSNPGGQGQELLRYAETDAARVAGLLGDLGGYRPERIQLLQRPSPAELLAAIDRVAETLEADAARGIDARFFFYYSGHARASGLSLGAEELPLDRLREKLLSLRSALTVVVLDACQSGAFSRVKGAQPAADFSFNSVARLNAKGVAVMASSSASELSQESERLGSSYFTHHLLVGLRGAGDSNRDGRVSLDEAYEYAYQRTLVSTASTAVGSQHVTLETDLHGQGDVALSYPARSDARLELPAALEADLLVHVRPGGAVVAELHKSRGAPVELALPHGAYRVLVRADERVRRCDITLAAHRRAVLSPALLAGCVDAPLELSTAKGPGDGAGGFSWSRVGLELGLGFTRAIDDGYTGRLQDFGFDDQIFIDAHWSAAVTYALRPNIDLVLDAGELDIGRWRRDNDPPHEFSWSTYSAALSLRYTHIAPGGWFRLFGQAGAGVARAHSIYDMTGMPGTDEDDFWGYRLSAAAGVQIVPWRRLGVFWRLGYDYAPVLENLIGDVHDSGGLHSGMGILTRF